jgi:polysaccharide biosynthesis transport protein
MDLESRCFKADSYSKDRPLMKNPFSYYTRLAKRWAWMVILGIVLCGGASYGISKITHPVYQASATLNLQLGTSTSAYENFTASVQAVPTYAQLLVSPSVLNPVVEQHPGLTFKQLIAMITVKPQTNTTLIELDVENQNPRLARDLANEVSEGLVQFANGQLSGTIRVLPAQTPTEPVRPKALLNTAIGALVGLVLALALIVIFEWIDDRPKSPEEVQELLGVESSTVIPWLSRRQRTKRAEEIPTVAEGYRLLSADLDFAQKITPFKLVMVTSALAGEGKSSIATHLAYFLAMAGKQVLLVDANLRSPALDQYFELEKRPELASAFTKARAGIEEYLDGQFTDIPNLQVMTAEMLPPDFMYLLPSPQGNQLFEPFQRGPFDYVIFDTPPLLPAADTQILASYMQAIVLVIDPAKTPRKLLLRTKRLLDKIHPPVLMAAINKSRWPEHGEIRQYLKSARHRRPASPAMTRPPETPSVNGLVGSSEVVTLILPPEASSLNGLVGSSEGVTFVLPAGKPSMNGLVDDSSDVTRFLPRLKAKEEDQS